MTSCSTPRRDPLVPTVAVSDHEAKVYPSLPWAAFTRWYARCAACWWTSPDLPTKAEALAAAERHVADPEADDG